MKKSPRIEYPHLFEDMRKVQRRLIRKGTTDEEYQYHLFSVGDLGTHMPVELIKEVKAGLVKRAWPYINECDCVVSLVPGGHQWGLLVADAVGLPLVIIRKQDYFKADELPANHLGQIPKSPGYSQSILQERKALFLDDVISSGMTAKFVLNLLKHNGSKIVAIIAIISKGGSFRQLKRECGVPIHALLQIDGEVISIAD